MAVSWTIIPHLLFNFSLYCTCKMSFPVDLAVYFGLFGYEFSIEQGLDFNIAVFLGVMLLMRGYSLICTSLSFNLFWNLSCLFELCTFDLSHGFSPRDIAHQNSPYYLNNGKLVFSNEFKIVISQVRMNCLVLISGRWLCLYKKR